MEKGYEIKVLDGYVRFVDSMGSDEAIVEAARMSTGRGFVSWNPYNRCKRCEQIQGHLPDGCAPEIQMCFCVAGGVSDFERFPRGDLGILDYLYKNRHTTPFEMCELIIDIQIPMDAWRQMIRHRTASVNEYSTRYTEAIDLMAATDPGAWRTQGVTNRQGSGAFLPEHEQGLPIGVSLSAREAAFHKEARAVYEERLAAGVAKEQARKDLPLSTYTAARWKCDLKNLLGFLSLRMHDHAQIEIRTYANAIAEIAKAIWPRTFALYEEHTQHAVTFSRSEVAVLRALIDQNKGADVDFAARKSATGKLGLVVS